MRNLLPILPNLIRKKGFIQPFLLAKKYTGAKKAGFTLLEVLIVSVILVIVMGSIAVIFVQASKSWTMTEAKLQIYQNARESLNRMSREIACVFQPSDANKQLNLESFSYTYDKDGLSYDSDKLKFTAALNVNPGSGEYDLTHLGYRLNTSDTGNPILQRYKKDYHGTYDPSIEDSSAWKEMAVNIISLNIRCYDGSDSTWYPSWNNAYLPKAVEVTIKVQDKQARFDPKEFKTEIYLPASQ